jgi:hypothetical protein
MMRTTAPVRKLRNFAHKAFKAFGFVNVKLLVEPPPPAAPSPVHGATSSGHAAELRIGWPTGPDASRQAAPTLQPSPPVSLEDWDVMFHAIELRLAQAVGERPDSAAPAHADDTAGHIQVVVLECISAMKQLHEVLKKQRAPKL